MGLTLAISPYETPLRQRTYVLKTRPHVYCAGQITGVEGYVESAASGHVAARRILARLRGTEFVPPPSTSAIGALLRHVSGEAHPPGYEYQPTNVVHALFPPLGERHRKHERKALLLARARRDLATWAAENGVALGPDPASWQSSELRP